MGVEEVDMQEPCRCGQPVSEDGTCLAGHAAGGLSPYDVDRAFADLVGGEPAAGAPAPPAGIDMSTMEAAPPMDGGGRGAVRSAGQWFAQDYQAQQAAEEAVAAGETMLVLEDSRGRYTWVAAAGEVRDLPGWIVSVLGEDGGWMAFAGHDAAVAFIRVQRAIEVARERLVSLALQAESKKGVLEAAAQWAAVLSTLRTERDALTPALS